MILDEIVADKKIELDRQKQVVSLNQVQQAIKGLTPTRDFKAALQGQQVKLIAEVKKASPSRGLICADFDYLKIARTYAENKAAAISVLTESRHFQGELGYLAEIHQDLGDRRPPLLRKDFIFDPYQIYESRACGADALLLIAAILDFRQLKELLDLSHELGLQCLVEAHNEDEVARAITAGAQIIGINNRDLQTFKVDLNTTARLRSLIPNGKIAVSESGIKSAADIQQLKVWEINAALVGETLMTSADIAVKMRELNAAG
jgi:indole-3-glycerol phosphate synthase